MASATSSRQISQPHRLPIGNAHRAGLSCRTPSADQIQQRILRGPGRRPPTPTSAPGASHAQSPLQRSAQCCPAGPPAARGGVHKAVLDDTQQMEHALRPWEALPSEAAIPSPRASSLERREASTRTSVAREPLLPRPAWPGLTGRRYGGNHLLKQAGGTRQSSVAVARFAGFGRERWPLPAIARS